MRDTPQTPSEVKDENAEYWQSEIDAAKDRQEHWYDKANIAIEKYQDDEEERAFGALNILWANVETQKAALGEDFGKPQVTRVNATSSMFLSRHVSLVWQQTIDAAVKETEDNREIRNAVHDILLPGRGQVWLELDPIMDDDGNVAWVEAPLVKVEYKDYLEGPANRWGQVPWVARGHLYTIDDLMDEFGLSKKKAEAIPREYKLPSPKDGKANANEDGGEQFNRARVWEIWAKFPDKRRIYFAEGHKEALKVTPDPYRLRRFFPCPRPILANGSEAWQRPLTDYSRYQDQAEEINRLSARIFVLTETLRRRGIYDKQYSELQTLASAGDNQFVAVDNYDDLQAKGGLKQVVQVEDLAPTIAVLDSLHKQRAELIRLTYELNGISDLARGQTDPNETATAQRLKRSYGGGRFQARKGESRRFAAEAYALKGEVIAEWFPREQIEEMSGVKLPTMAEQAQARMDLQNMMRMSQQAQQNGQQMPFDQYQLSELQEIANAPCTWEKVSSILRTDKRRCYMVEVETDQHQYTDEDQDKKARIEFAGVLNQMMQQFGPMISANPANGQVFKQIMLFVVSAFKAGRGVEQEFEQAIDAAIQQAAQQQGQQQQDPKAAADAQVAQLKVQQAQISLQKEQVQLQQAIVEAQQAGADIQLGQVQAQQKAVSEQQKLAQGDMKLQQQAEANRLQREGQMIDNINRAEQLDFERQQRMTAREAYLRDNPEPPAGVA